MIITTHRQRRRHTVAIMWEYAAWGLAGGLSIEGVEILRAKHCRTLPWNSFGRYIYISRVIIRMALGACVAAALGSSGQINNASMALMAGAGAPLFLEKLSQITQIIVPQRGALQQRPEAALSCEVTLHPAEGVSSVMQEKSADAN
jgi:hypothetical protein